MHNAQAFATYSFGLDSLECARFRSIPNNSKRLLIFLESRTAALRPGPLVADMRLTVIATLQQCSGAKVQNYFETKNKTGRKSSIHEK